MVKSFVFLFRKLFITKLFNDFLTLFGIFVGVLHKLIMKLLLFFLLLKLFFLIKFRNLRILAFLYLFILFTLILTLVNLFLLLHALKLFELFIFSKLFLRQLFFVNLRLLLAIIRIAQLLLLRSQLWTVLVWMVGSRLFNAILLVLTHLFIQFFTLLRNLIVYVV